MILTRHPRLTPRQQQVIEYAAAGMTSEQTAHALGLSEHTLRHHREIAMRRLGATSMAHAVAIYVAWRAALVSPVRPRPRRRALVQDSLELV